MKRLLRLFGWDSLLLFVLCCISGIVLSFCHIQTWLSTLCWSIVSSSIVYGVTVILPRYRNMKNMNNVLLKRVDRLISVGQYLFENIQAAQYLNNDPQRCVRFEKKIPDSSRIEKICQKINLSQNPSRMITFVHESPSWNTLIVDQCGKNLERNVHEIIAINALDNSDLTSLVDDLQDAYDNFKLSFLLSVDAGHRGPCVLCLDDIKKLASLFRKLEIYALQCKSKV